MKGMKEESQDVATFASARENALASRSREARQKGSAPYWHGTRSDGRRAISSGGAQGDAASPDNPPPLVKNRPDRVPTAAATGAALATADDDGGESRSLLGEGVSGASLACVLLVLLVVGVLLWKRGVTTTK